MSSAEEGTPPTSAPLAELPITSDRAPSFAARPGGGRKGQPPFFCPQLCLFFFFDSEHFSGKGHTLDCSGRTSSQKHHILTIAQLWLMVPVGVPGKHISGTEAFSPAN